MPRKMKTMLLLKSFATLAAMLFVSTAIAMEDTDDVFLEKMIHYSLAVEQRILQEGRPLTDTELLIAQQANVRHADRVRILILDAVPVPQDEFLQQELEELGVLKLIGGAQGAAKGYGIILTKSGAKRRAVIAHELVHVGQYERLGGIAELMRYHLPDLKANGYRRSELEDEAYRRAAKIIGASR